MLLETDRWLRASEAARLIGVVKPTLMSWGDRGPKYTIWPSGERRYKLSDLEAWLTSRPTGGKQ